MARSINQVEEIFFAVFGLVPDRDGMGLNRDAPLTFQVHGVEDLLPGFPEGNGTGIFEQTVRKSRFPVVYVRNDREVSYAGLQRVSFGWNTANYNCLWVTLSK